MAQRGQKSKTATNPLTEDPELKKLLDKARKIQSTADFDNWKTSFLSRLERFLDPDGIAQARKTYVAFSTYMDQFGLVVVSLLLSIDQGHLTPTNVSVRGRNALNEVNRGATEAMEEIIKWLPTNTTEEKELGYTKWQLGAVLVRDGFEVYETMTMCRDMLNSSKESTLKYIADRQILDAIEYYERQIVRFCDVMADLGLYDLMMKSHQTRSPEYLQEKRQHMEIEFQQQKNVKATRRPTPTHVPSKENKENNDNVDALTDTSGDGKGDTADSPPADNPADDGNGGKGGNGGGDGDGPSRPDLRVRFGSPLVVTYPRKLKQDDVVFVPDLFGPEDDHSNYNRVVAEVPNWKPDGDGTHVVCDNASSSQTVQNVMERVCEYFSIRKSSVGAKVHWYRNSKETHKPHREDSS
jgi:hypothetical protein